MFPLLIINMKTYPELLGGRSLELARIAEGVSREIGVNIMIAPPMTDIRLIASSVEIPVLAQGADAVEPGARTGYVPLEFVKDAGAVGVILNHSEKKLPLNDIGWLIRRSRELGLWSIACAPDPELSSALASLEPSVVAIEPPELIGTGKAVSREKPDTIIKAVELVAKVNPKVKVITGAGIESAEDVRKALALGTAGVLVSSSIIKSNWERKIRELAQGLIQP